MNLTPQEAAWLHDWFLARYKGMPSSRSYEPHYDATSYDLTDLLDVFRKDASGSREAVSLVVSELTIGHKWPRLKMKDAFWVSARWGEAYGFCIVASGRGKHLAIPAIPPRNAPAAIGWLLQEAWDTRFADQWVRENARNYFTVDDPTIGESITDLEIFLRKLEGRL